MSRQTAHTLKLTFAEAAECRRALHLIMQEDASCDVNMDAASVAAKQSALQKLETIAGRDPLSRLLDSAESVLVSDLRDQPKGKS